MTAKRIGLALSGGGFRATLFHLGVARFLKDADLLKSVSHITSVSGGSIFAGHLALNWERYTGPAEGFDEAADELLRFVQLDVRNRIIRRYPFFLVRAGARRLIGLGRDRHLSRTGMLERYYAEYLFGPACLFNLPTTPQLHILSTNLSEGVLCSFSRDGLIVQRRSSGHGVRFDRVPVGLATVAMAVTASSAFPAFFPPLVLRAEDVGATEGEFPRQAFTDGGVFDNLGVRMFKGITDSWLAHQDPLSAPDMDEQGLAEALRAASVEHAGPLAYIARRLTGSGPRSMSDERSAGLPALPAQQHVEALWNIIMHSRLYREPDFEQVKLQDPDTQRFLEFVRSTGRDLEWGDHLWLNRQLLAAALREATGKDILSAGAKVFDKVIVSDAGQQFKVAPSGAFGGLVGTAIRSSDILMDRVWQLEKEAFEATPGFMWMPISRIVEPAMDPEALHPEVQRQVGRIRTDLDRFSSLEISGLVRHGYCVARAAYTADPLLAGMKVPEGPPWDPIARRHPKKSSHTGHHGREAEEARKLQPSSQRRILGALFSWRDRASYAYIPLFLCLAAVPYWLWQVYDEMRVADQVIEAISESSPDVQTVLNLLRWGSVAPWDSLPIEKTSEMPVTEASGFDILSDTRIVDLRALKQEQSDGEQSRHAYAYLRLQMRKREDKDAGDYLKITFPSSTELPLLRTGNPEHKPRVRRWERPAGDDAKSDMTYPFIYEVTFDLSQTPPGFPVEVVLEFIVAAGEVEKRFFAQQQRWLRIWTIGDTDLLTTWVFFPESAPYESFDVVVAPKDDLAHTNRVRPNQKFLIEDGSILGWRLANAKEGHMYEVRWQLQQ
jgi:predicted acylesterase/phospholipase RssA